MTQAQKLNSRAIQIGQEKQDVPRLVGSIGLKRNGNARYILSFGAGVNSTALMILLIKKRLPLDHIVFADTGDERPETYAYLSHVRNYLRDKAIPFETVRVRNGDTLHDRCMRRKVIPSETWRWCTRDLKIRPIFAFYRSLNSHIYQYVGIDYDEVHRMKDSKVQYITNVYPLIDYRISREKCIDMIRNEGLPIPIKSGCYFCPFNPVDRWVDLYEKHPELYSAAMEMEENGKHMPKQKLTPLTLRGLKMAIEGKKSIPMISIPSPCGSECMT